MLVGNEYLFALFLFALIVEVLMLPFGIMQQKNSIRQAKLKPKEMAIRKKYAGREDRETQQKLSTEIQEMYQEEHISPMAGCLPMLIQFPILIALYNIVLNPLKYICGLSENAISQLLNVVKSFPEYADSLKNATAERTIELMGATKEILSEYGADVFAGVEGFSAAIPDVGALPNLTLFGGAIDLAQTPSFIPLTWLTLIPLLTFVVYFFSMKITRKLTYQPAMAANDQATGCSNKMMDFTMPLMSVFIAFGVPAAIGVYWIFKSIITSLKQFILHKAMPLPKFTEEDYKAAEREMGIRGSGKNKDKNSGRPVNKAVELNERNAAVPKSERVGSVRSLHHIDDEDFEDTKDRAARAKAAIEAAEAEKAAQKKQRDTKISLDGAVKKDETDRKAKKSEKTETPETDTPSANGGNDTDNNN